MSDNLLQMNVDERCDQDSAGALSVDTYGPSTYSLTKIHVEIQGVQAKVHLRVRLDNVYKIIDRTLTTVDMR
jgi:hypothetical protein